MDERSPLLSASHSGNVTPTAPPYLQESSPRGKAGIDLSASHGNVWKEECRGALARRRRRASHLGRGRRMLAAAFPGGACLSESLAAGLHCCWWCGECVLEHFLPGFRIWREFPKPLFPKQPLSVAGRWCRSSSHSQVLRVAEKNPGYCSPWHLSLRGLEH